MKFVQIIETWRPLVVPGGRRNSVLGRLVVFELAGKAAFVEPEVDVCVAAILNQKAAGDKLVASLS